MSSSGNIVYSSAVLCFSVSTEEARNREIDKIIIHSVVRRGLEQHFRMADVCDSLREEIPLRVELIRKSISRNIENGNVVMVSGSPENISGAVLCLSRELIERTKNEGGRIKQFIAEATKELLGGSYLENEQEKMENLLLDCISRLMAKYGYAYAGQIVGLSDASTFVPREELRKICEASRKEYNAFEVSTDQLEEAVGALFDRRDPCLNNLAFSICRRYYSSRIIGLDLPLDFLSGQIYRGAVFFLDTNVVHGVALSSLKKHNEFKTIVSFSPKLGVSFAVTELTLAEIAQKVGQFRSLLDSGDKILPNKIMDEVRERILEDTTHGVPSPAEIKVARTGSAKRLSEMGIGIVQLEDKDLAEGEALKTLMSELHEFDRKIRASPKLKDENALYHDAQLCWIVERRREAAKVPNAAWFLTADNSVVAHGASRKGKDGPPYSVKVPALLQTLSPFVEGQALKAEFEDLFADIVSRDILPEDLLFTAEDLRLFVGVDVKALEISPQDLRKAMHHIKQEILKDGALTEEKRPLVVQELNRYLLRPDSSIVETVRRYERKMELLEEELRTKDARLERLESERQSAEESIHADLEKIRKSGEKAEDDYRQLKEKAFSNYVILVGIIVSVFIWSAYFSLAGSFPAWMKTPFFVFLAGEMMLISVCLSAIYSERKGIVAVAGGIMAVASILISLI